MLPAERDALIAEEYATLSAPKLAAKYRLSIPQIRRIVAEAGPTTKKIQLGTEGKVIDENHRIIGMKLYFHRVTIKLQGTEDGSKSLEWSMKKMRNIEQGFTSLTLDDLLTIAKYLGISLPTLVEKITWSTPP